MPWGPPDPFAAAEDDHVRPLLHEARQVDPGGQSRRRVHDHRNVVGMGDHTHLLQRQGPPVVERGDQIGHGRRPLVDGALQLPGVRTLAVPYLHQLGSRRSVGLVVGKPVGVLDDYLVLHSLGVGQPLHLYRIAARDTGRGLKHETSGRAAGHEPRLGAGDPGQYLARLLVELGHVHQHARRGGHDLQGLGTGPRPSEACRRARSVDDGAHSYASVDVTRVPAGCGHGSPPLVQRIIARDGPGRDGQHYISYVRRQPRPSSPSPQPSRIKERGDSETGPERKGPALRPSPGERLPVCYS